MAGNKKKNRNSQHRKSSNPVNAKTPRDGRHGDVLQPDEPPTPRLNHGDVDSCSQGVEHGDDHHHDRRNHSQEYPIERQGSACDPPSGDPSWVEIQPDDDTVDTRVGMLANMKEKLEQQNSQIRALQTENDGLRDEMEKKQQEHATEIQKQKYDEEMNKQKYDEMKEEHAKDMEMAKQAYNEEALDLCGKINDLERKVQQCTDTISDRENEIQQLKAAECRNSDASERLLALGERYERLATQFDDLKHEREELVAQIRRGEASISDLKQQNRRLREQNSRLREQNTSHARLPDHGDDPEHWLKGFLATVGAKDLAGAERAWFESQRRLAELRGTEATLKKLQAEVLSSVDRHNPNFDEGIQRDFVTLNKRIGNLVKDPTMAAFAQAGGSAPLLQRWIDGGVLFKGSVNPRFDPAAVEPKKEHKFLLRHAVWKFLSDQLFDVDYPFASFGSDMARDRFGPVFAKFFPDPATNEAAARWRSLTVKQLKSVETAEDRNRRLHELVSEFASMVSENMQVEWPEDSVPLVILLKEGGLGRKVHEVFSAALDFVQDLMGERAGFSLGVPPLRDVAFAKATDDDRLTTTASVGVDPSEEDELVGAVRYVVSPMLIKWGSGNGENLHQHTILMKAFVKML